MNIPWSDADRLVVDRARAFAASTLAGRPKLIGVDRVAWRACAGEGVFAAALHRDWHGEGRSLRLTASIFEALGRGGADRGLLFAMGAHLFGCTLPIAKHGSANHRDRYSRGLTDGSLVAALAMTEATSGTSPACWTSRLERDGNDYRLSGEKLYVSNAPDADLFLVFAAEGSGTSGLALTALVVPRDTSGLTVEPLQSVGLSGSPMGRVIFAGCRVPADAVLGASRAGLGVLNTCLRLERTCILAGFIGAAARDLATCVARMKQRRDATGPLLRHQAVAHRLARMHCGIEAARSLLDHAVDAIDRGVAVAHDAAMVKLRVSEELVACALNAMQIVAGAGAIDDDGMASALADTVLTLSASGTSEAQLNAIASALPHLYA